MTDSVWSRLQGELSAWPGSDPLGSVEEMKLAQAENFEYVLAQVLSFQLNWGRHKPKLFLAIYDTLRRRREVATNFAADLVATYERDQACASLLEGLLFRKGLQALGAYRISWAARAEGNRRFAAALQYRTSTVFGIDIHPGAQIDGGVVLDHGTGVVIGETAEIETGCYLFHGVTLGSTGAETGKRHPTIRQGAFLGAGTTVLGSVEVGERAVVAAGSVVVRSVPEGRLVGGAPAKDLGEAPNLLPPQSKKGRP